MKSLLLPLFLLIFIGFQESRASVGIITGTVTDKIDGKGIPGVKVSFGDPKNFMVTNKHGNYKISLVGDVACLF